jgi:hypothetical protein
MCAGEIDGGDFYLYVPSTPSLSPQLPIIPSFDINPTERSISQLARLRWGLQGRHGDYFENILYAGIWYFPFILPWGHISYPLTSNQARELTLEAAQSASTAKGPRTDYNSRGFDPPHIKKLLDSRSERDILEGMRRVISVWKEQLFPLPALFLRHDFDMPS